jgi:hypothetical protein
MLGIQGQQHGRWTLGLAPGSLRWVPRQHTRRTSICFVSEHAEPAEMRDWEVETGDVRTDAVVAGELKRMQNSPNARQVLGGHRTRLEGRRHPALWPNLTRSGLVARLFTLSLGFGRRSLERANSTCYAHGTLAISTHVR